MGGPQDCLGHALKLLSRFGSSWLNSAPRVHTMTDYDPTDTKAKKHCLGKFPSVRSELVMRSIYSEQILELTFSTNYKDQVILRNLGWINQIG